MDPFGIALRQHLQQRAKAAEFGRGSHDAAHRRRNLGLLRRGEGHVFAVDELSHEALDECKVCRRGLELQRGEAARHTELERVVLATERSHGDRRAEILVEEHGRQALCGRLIELQERCEEKRLQHRLARAGRPDDHGVGKLLVVGVELGSALRIGAVLALMKIEVVGSARCGAKHCHRIAPLVAADAAGRIVVKAAEPGEVAGSSCPPRVRGI